MKRLISIGEAERLAKDYISEGNDDALYDLVAEVLSQDKVLGSVDDFHNFAIDFSRKDDYYIACQILDKGISLFPKAVDLLADYLQYGINCDRLALCEEHFNTLTKIPLTRWTWRGFSFSINYMQFLADMTDSKSELEEWKERMLDLSEKYQKCFSYSEDAFLTKANIFRYFNDNDQETIVLENAIKHVKSCPKCALRLADIYFNRGEYRKSLDYIELCKYSAIQTQEKINQAYMYYLSGLCKVAELHQNNSYNNRDLIIDIYQDFAIAEKLNLNFSSYQKVIERQINILEYKTKVLFEEVDY